MPLTEKGRSILKSMEKIYGPEKAKQVLYASKNAGKISGIDAAMYDDDVVRADRSLKIDAICDAVGKLSTRIDAYCSRMDDHRVIGGVRLPLPK